MFTVFRPVPSRHGHAGLPGLQRQLQPPQVGPVPGHEKQVVMAPSQWHAMSAGGILKNSLLVQRKGLLIALRGSVNFGRSALQYSLGR